jgi:hypothetical protein
MACGSPIAKEPIMNFDTMIQELTRIVGEEGVIVDAGRKLVYEYDASFDTHPPDVVVLPQTTEQVSAIAVLAAQYDVPLVARGAGTAPSVQSATITALRRPTAAPAPPRRMSAQGFRQLVRLGLP